MVDRGFGYLHTTALVSPYLVCFFPRVHSRGSTYNNAWWLHHHHHQQQQLFWPQQLPQPSPPQQQQQFYAGGLQCE